MGSKHAPSTALAREPFEKGRQEILTGAWFAEPLLDRDHARRNFKGIASRKDLHGRPQFRREAEFASVFRSISLAGSTSKDPDPCIRGSICGGYRTAR